MPFRKIRVDGIPLTLELAKEFASAKPLPGERDERPARREYLLKEVRNGMFGGPSWARGIERRTDSTYRLDGQHSSKLLASLPDDVAFPEGLLVTIDTWEFDSVKEDAAGLFNLFNHPKSARTNEDAMGIYRASARELADLDRKFLLKIGNGIADYEAGLPKKMGVQLLPPRERGLYFIQNPRYAEFACWVSDFRDTKNAVFLSRSPVIAEILADWLAYPDHANEFWGYVLKENHPDVDHDTRSLAEAFRAMSMQKKHRPDEYRKKAKRAWRNYLLEIRVDSEPAQESLPLSPESTEESRATT